MLPNPKSLKVVVYKNNIHLLEPDNTLSGWVYINRFPYNAVIDYVVYPPIELINPNRLQQNKINSLLELFERYWGDKCET